MKGVIENREWFATLVEQNSASMPVNTEAPFAELKRHAGSALQTIPLPDRSQENWRYSSLDRLYQHLFTLSADQPDIDESDLGRPIFDASNAYRIVLVNGRIAPQLCHLPNADEGIQIFPLSELSAEQRNEFETLIREHDSFKDDAFAQVNRALTNDGLYLKISRDSVPDRPIELVHVNRAHGQQILVPPSFLIMLEQGARAELVERYLSHDDSQHFFNAMTDIVLQEESSLHHYRIQNEGALAHHLSRISLHQRRASQYQSAHVALNAGWGRSDIRANLLEPGAVCRINGLYTVGASQHNDFHIDVRHKAPDCLSDTMFRGVAYGPGKAVFDGRILVEKDAQRTDAQLSNKNLLLVEDAEVNTKPQLEIYADDVKCSHGTTVGGIDPNQLFYLRSRGIDEQQAFRMLCLGFVQQVVSNIDNLALRDSIQRDLATTLSGASQ